MGAFSRLHSLNLLGTLLEEQLYDLIPLHQFELIVLKEGLTNFPL
jgi:hypothetical protein